MAELIVDDEDLVVHLTLGEKIWGFHGDIRVRLSPTATVAADPKPWLGLRGWRMRVSALPGTLGWAPACTAPATISASCTAMAGGPGGRGAGTFQQPQPSVVCPRAATRRAKRTRIAAAEAIAPSAAEPL